VDVGNHVDRKGTHWGRKLPEVRGDDNTRSSHRRPGAMRGPL
jgi:hypothetical protein